MEDKQLGELDIQFELDNDELAYEDEPTIEPIYIDNSNVTFSEYDEEKFQEGLNDISYLCGQITGLVNAGIPPSDALAYLTDMEVLKSNYKMAELNKETSVAVAKEQAIQVEKNSL